MALCCSVDVLCSMKLLMFITAVSILRAKRPNRERHQHCRLVRRAELRRRRSQYRQARASSAPQQSGFTLVGPRSRRQQAFRQRSRISALKRGAEAPMADKMRCGTPLSMAKSARAMCSATGWPPECACASRSELSRHLFARRVSGSMSGSMLARARSSPSTWRGRVRGEGGRPECRLDLLLYRIEVDAERGQRVAIEGCRTGRRRCVRRADQADELRLDALKSDAPLAQQRSDLATGGGKAVQQVLAADEAVPEAARLLGCANNNLPGVAGESFGHRRLPRRGTRLRGGACSVKPSWKPSAYAD